MSLETRTDILSGDAERAPPGVLRRYFARFDDGELIRWAFRGLLIGTIGVLALDLKELVDRNGGFLPASPDAPAITEPVLPPAVDTGTDGTPTTDPRDFVTDDETTLRQPIRFELRSGGVLSATGSIDAGAALRFADEIDARGEYVRTIELNSPGGSLDDAMAMAKLIREKRLSTSIPDGAICASSCPLMMAGGVQRSAGPKSAVGLHQFYAVGAAPADPAQAMADAQLTTARITRHLVDMGVDPTLWLHALDTPPTALYYLSPAEMTAYRLVGRSG